MVKKVTSGYLYARAQDERKNRAPLTCSDVLGKNLCPGQMYLEDPKLKAILERVSPYLTHNILTENDLRMASLALEYREFQARNSPKYKPDYENPKVAYSIMSSSYPSHIPFALDHIQNKTGSNALTILSFDYNSNKLDDFQTIMQNYTNVKLNPTHWLANWGGISLVYLEVSAWLELLKMDGWNYLINLSDTDAFIVPADLIQQRVKELNGSSVLECPFRVRYPSDQKESCIIEDASYRYNDVWMDCGSSVRFAKHPAFSPRYPPYVNFKLKGSQWKVLSRAAIEKMVSSQDFWDILFSYRSSFVPDEHILYQVAKQLPDEPFIYRTIHFMKMDVPIDQKNVLEAIKRGYWFIRKVKKPQDWQVVEKVREKHFAKAKEEHRKKKK
jgi:hypothetical protein